MTKAEEILNNVYRSQQYAFNANDFIRGYWHNSAVDMAIESAKQTTLSFSKWKEENLYKVPDYASKSESELYDVFNSGVEL